MTERLAHLPETICASCGEAFAEHVESYSPGMPRPKTMCGGRILGFHPAPAPAPVVAITGVTTEEEKDGRILRGVEFTAQLAGRVGYPPPVERIETMGYGYHSVPKESLRRSHPEVTIAGEPCTPDTDDVVHYPATLDDRVRPHDTAPATEGAFPDAVEPPLAPHPVRCLLPKPAETRHIFQLWWDAIDAKNKGKHEQAANDFGQVARLDVEPEIIFVAMLERAKCMTKLYDGTPATFAVITDAFLDAHRMRPSRAEAIRHLIKWGRNVGRPEYRDILWNALPLDKETGKIIATTDRFMVEAWCYVDGGSPLHEPISGAPTCVCGNAPIAVAPVPSGGGTLPAYYCPWCNRDWVLVGDSMQERNDGGCRR